jgi:hypothetical protein
MKNAIADDIAVKDTSAKKRRRKTGPKTAAQSKGKGKAREDENTDPEDNDFLGSGSDGETSDEDSDSSIEILNSEVSLHLDSSIYLTSSFLHSWPNLSRPKPSLRTRDGRQRRRPGTREKGRKPLLRRYIFSRLTLACLIIVLISLQPDNTDGNATMAGPSTAGLSTPSQQPQASAPAAKSVCAFKSQDPLRSDRPAYRKNPTQSICFTRILPTVMQRARKTRVLNIINVIWGIERS